MTCDKCHEVHTTDCLNLYFTPGVCGEPKRVCFFCDYDTEIGPKNGTMGCKPGEKAPTATREEDRLEAEATLVGL